MSLFTFGADDVAYSKFSPNLKPETYNPLVIAYTKVGDDKDNDPKDAIGGSAKKQSQSRIFTQDVLSNGSINLREEQKRIQSAEYVRKFCGWSHE